MIHRRLSFEVGSLVSSEGVAVARAIVSVLLRSRIIGGSIARLSVPQAPVTTGPRTRSGIPASLPCPALPSLSSLASSGLPTSTLLLKHGRKQSRRRLGVE